MRNFVSSRREDTHDKALGAAYSGLPAANEREIFKREIFLLHFVQIGVRQLVGNCQYLLNMLFVMLR